MCGIAGFRDASADRGQLLASALSHRGPDGAWAVEFAGHTLVQTRLAVVDLSERVRYPMLNESGTLALLFNGEIYDHPHLRRRLERVGHVFRTDCDAEVVLHGFEEWGEGVFEQLDGMFAAALVHQDTGELVLARDALGIKPLVCTAPGAPGVGFASDAVALVRAGLSRGHLDHDALRAFLALHYVPGPATGLSDVVQVDPGTVVRIDRAGRREVRRWARDPLAGPAPTERVARDEIRDAVCASVARQSIADVPVGVFLSGGVDSALILAAAVRAGHQPVAFTIGFAAHGDYDEQPLAAAAAAALGVPHRHEPLQGGFAETLDGVAAAFDMPFADSSAIATLQLARLARREVTVALSGTGGDELFAGYARTRAHRLLAPLRAVPGPLRRALGRLEPPRGTERAGRGAVLRARLARLASLDPADPLAQYLGLVGSMSGEAAIAATVFEAEVPGSMRAPLARGNSVLRELSRLDLATYLPGDVLTKEDRATMAVGLESRVPLLGRDVLELAGRLPDAQKATLRRGKIALRELAAELVPHAATASAPKRGFAVPLGPLLAGPWRDEASERLRAATGAVDGQRAHAALQAGQLTPADTWMLASLDAWERRVEAARRAAQSEALA